MEPMESKSVLILCTGNSCRSQMAEVIWNQLGSADKSNPDKPVQWTAISAGSKPSGYVHELALVALSEIDLPSEGLTSKSSDPFQDTPFDLVVTVCDNAKEACPIWPSAKKLLHWPFEDPADATGTDQEKLEVFRKVRDQIKDRIAAFLESGAE